MAEHVMTSCIPMPVPLPERTFRYVTYTIEIINNTRVAVEGKKRERGFWRANSSPGCSLIHDVPGEKVVLDEFYCFLKCFSS